MFQVELVGHCKITGSLRPKKTFHLCAFSLTGRCKGNWGQREHSSVAHRHETLPRLLTLTSHKEKPLNHLGRSRKRLSPPPVPWPSQISTAFGGRVKAKPVCRWRGTGIPWAGTLQWPKAGIPCLLGQDWKLPLKTCFPSFKTKFGWHFVGQGGCRNTEKLPPLRACLRLRPAQKDKDLCPSPTRSLTLSNKQ